ncbi:hypothetical protein AMECASPLE_032117, partial [Ameca splendens]
SSEPMRQVRLRLAACRLIQQEKTASDLPGGRWNISPSRHRADAHVQRTEEDVLEEEEQETSLVPLFGSQHECPLVQQKIGGLALLDLNHSHSDLSSNLNLRVPRVLWPMTDQEKMKKQRQSQFLLHRRLAMNTEREQVKENKQLRKHLKRTARIKAEKEKLRQEEEMKLERARMLAEAKQRLEERELLILERLKLEEEGAMQLQRRNREEKGNNSARFVEALRAQMKERLSQMKQELPPLCCCASSFWDSHPDTCANNCIFHNNPRGTDGTQTHLRTHAASEPLSETFLSSTAYAKALQSTMVSLDLQ